MPNIEEFRKLSFTSADVPEGWHLVPLPEDGALIVVPDWLFEKIRNNKFISDRDFSDYKSEVGDLEIDYYLKTDGKEL